LLEELNFDIPKHVTRLSSYFYLPAPSSNILFLSRVYKMCSTYNKISKECDFSLPQKSFRQLLSRALVKLVCNLGLGDSISYILWRFSRGFI